MRALIVDDDAVCRLMMMQVLEAEGYIVVEASNGLQAINLINEYRPHITICNVQVPYVSGWQINMMIKHKFLPFTHFVFIASREKKDELMVNNVKHYILKPCSPAQMLEVINKVLLHKTDEQTIISNWIESKLNAGTKK